MKKVLSLIFILCLTLVCLIGCDWFTQPCEHEWTDATCTAPKTCSLCGATDGEAIGHTEETVAGKAATCTEAGMTDGKKCSVCGVTTVEQTVIAALGHTEETIAGTPATCTEAGKTDGKKCTVCGVTTVEQTVIAALGHKPGADDGDVTTPVKCANEGCDYVFVEAKDPIILTIPAFENGAVVADKKNYAIGDTVKLTVNPDFGYTQKLTLDGEPLMLDWNNNIYSFVVEKDTYVLDGTFELTLDLAPSDAARWETGNQAHGILTTYYPANNDSWWMAFKGDYQSLSVIAKNYLPIEETKDNFFVYLRVTMENGNSYNFRIGTDKGGYTAYNRAGIQNPGDANVDWGSWKNLSKLDSKITTEGVEFKVERQGANTLVLTIDGEVVDTYTMNGITSEDKIASIDVKHQGSQGKYIDMPFVLTSACNHDWIDATCTAPKTCSICKVTIGEKLNHTYTNYVSNNDATCTADGTKTGTCVCGEKDTIADEGSALGHKEEIIAGKDATCTATGMTDGKKCTVCGETTLEQTEIPIKSHIDDDNDYVCDDCLANLCTNHTEEIIAGTAATCTTTGLTEGKKCSVCGGILVEQEIIPAKGHKAGEDDGDCTTAVKCINEGCGETLVAALTHNPVADDGDVTTAVKCANKGCEQILVPAKEAITLTIPTFENGTVTADKMNYAIGDTVTLTIDPEDGYFQKLYINGEALLLDWKTFDYSFVATEDAYEITGSFERGLNLAPSDWGRWDDHNQLHGVLNTYYPNNNDSWWMAIKGNYNSLSINVKNYLPIGETADNFYVYLRVTMENGNTYNFRIGTDKGGYTAYNRAGIQNPGDSSADWSHWKNLSKLDSKITTEGVEFKVERQGANTLVLTVDGEVVDTYTMNGITADDKIASIDIKHQGNKGKYVETSFVLTNACNHTWVDATCTAPKTCSICKVTIGEKLDHTYTNYVSNNDATCTADGTKTGTCVCGEKNTIVDEGSAKNHPNKTTTTVDATCTAAGSETVTCDDCGETLSTNVIPAKDHTDDDNNYKCDDCGANLCTDHVEEIVAGKDATCTESGLTEGKRCSICGSVILAQEIIPAKGHKASEDDGDCTTAVKCSNAGCDYVFVDAKEHTPAADDGDVTTAVKCANDGCQQEVIPAKEAINLTISDFEHGAVTTDKINYAIGDTVTLTIAPEGGYFQKLYINGEPLMLGWKTKTYSFVAEENTYVIDGSFEPTLEVYAGDWGRWDNANQAHGHLSAYYPSNNDAWWFKIKGNYSSFSINAKNYRDIANSYEGGPDGGWRIALYMQLDNGKYYAFSMWIDAGQKYAYNHFGGNIDGVAATTGWSGAWRDLAVVNAEATAALNGNGAEFKLERIDGNHIQITLGGVVLETYEISGVTAENKVVSVGLLHYGNKGARVDIPFELTKGCAHTWVDATCTAPKTCSICKVTIGEKLDHTYNNYVSNNDATCTADGTKTGTCVCGEKNTIADEGSMLDHEEETVAGKDATCTTTGLTEGKKCSVCDKIILAQEVIPALSHKEEAIAGKDATCTETGLTEGKKCSVCGVITIEQTVIPAKGHTDDDKDFECDVCHADLCTDHVEEIVAGIDATCTASGLTEGKKCSICGKSIVEQTVIPALGHKEETVAGKDATCTEDGLTEGKNCSVCGITLAQQTVIPAKGHKAGEDDGDCTTAVKCINEGCGETLVAALTHNPVADDGDVTTAVKCANKGCEQILVPAKEAITLTIPTFENGTVTADKMNYAIGDTVTLTIDPEDGYFQKLYINGEALLLDWKTFDYSFVATEDAYEITGSFERGLNLAPSDWGRWDDHNQLHGVLNTYYPNNNDSWWMAIKGNYNSLSINVKNYLPIGETADNFYVYLRVTMENGNTYNFRIGTDKGGYTAYNRAGIQNPGDSSADWSHWKNLSKLDSKITTEGVEFKVERQGANTLVLTVDGEVVDTYTMNGITAEDKIASIDMKYQGNQGKYVDIPFALTVPSVEEEPSVPNDDVTLTIGEFANGTVTADKDSYKIGDTVTLTLAPNAGYFQKLYINGEPLMLDWKTFDYSFVATENAYEITGSFEQGLSLKPGDWGRWDDHNQLHGVLNTYYPSNGDSWWMDINGEYQSVEITAKNLVPKADSMDGNGQNGYMQIIRFGLSNGKTYAFRIYNDKGTYAVSCTAVSGSSSGWGNWKNVANVLGYSIDDAMSGDGVQFKVERTSADTMTVSVNGVVMFTYTMDGVTEADTVTFVGIQSNANSGKYVEIPYEVK